MNSSSANYLQMTMYPQCRIVTHPLIQHKMSFLRLRSTNQKEFRELVHEITLLLAYEATREMALVATQIATPLETCEAFSLPTDKKPVILPILRAGLGMEDAFLRLMPEARVGHIGIFRNEKTLQPERYYFKIPKNSENCPYFICDPMLATGGSLKAAIAHLKSLGIQNIVFICIVAVPQGLSVIADAFPEVPIYCASVDRELNANGYILPGLGDAGDRLFGTQ